MSDQIDEVPEVDAPESPDMPPPADAPIAGVVDVVGSQAPEPVQPAPQQAFALQGPTTPVDTATYLKQADADWRDDLESGHITPKTYADMFGKKDTAGKIGTLFGLLISGAGSGLAKQENAVLKMMDKEIDQDFEAQKQSKTNAQNFLRLNQQHQLEEAQKGLIGAQAYQSAAQGDVLADAKAQMQTNRAQFHKLAMDVQKLAAAAAADPTNQAKQQQLQRAQQALGVIGQALDDKNANIADRAAATSALLGGLNQGAAPSPNDQFQQRQQAFIASGNPALGALAQDEASKFVPGLGKAVIPLNSEDRIKIDKGMVFQNQLNRFIDWTKENEGSLSPSKIKEGHALASELQSAYRQAINGGPYSPNEQDFISKIVDSTPTKFFNSIRVLPQLKAVQKDSGIQFNSFLKSKGLPEYQSHGEKPKEKSGQNKQPVERVTKDGRTALFDPDTKQFLRYK